MPGRYSRLSNVGLRMATLAIRFLFIFFLARFLEPAAVGVYGLFTATISFVLYFIGMDFYVYSTREVLKLPPERRARPLKAQIALSLGLYAVVLPVVLAVITQLGWPGHLVWWFLLIVVLEHVNQEIFRLLVALSQQVAAGILMFVRQGSWALAAIGLMAWRPETRNLDVVMALWGAAGIATALIGALRLHRQRLGGWDLPVDWHFVRAGVRVSGAFLTATLALRAIQTVDRYLLQSFAGLDTVAAYVLFLGMAGALLTFLDAGVFAFGYPALISLHQQGDTEGFRQRLRQIFVQTLAACAAFAVVSWVMMPWLLGWIGNPVYLQAVGLYPWLLLAMVLNALGMVPHYALYASGRDKPIIHSHLAALPVFLAAAWALSRVIPDLAVPAALSMSFGLILLWKAVAYQRMSADPAQPTRSSEP